MRGMSPMRAAMRLRSIDLRQATVRALERGVDATIVARQIVAREVTTSPEIITELVRRTLTEFPIDQALRIRVNPMDLSMLTANSQDKQPLTGSRETSWFADPRIVRGGCLVEGRDRIIDGRVDAALERAYHHMAQIDAS